MPGAAPYLRDIHVFNPAAFVSAGVPVGDVPSMKRDIPAVIRRISHDLFIDDLAVHTARIHADVPADFDASLYAHRVWQTDAAVSAASTILSQTVKGQVADDLLAKGITEVRAKLN